jgi:hypothetical protein
MKNSNDIIGIRTRDLLLCSTLPHKRSRCIGMKGPEPVYHQSINQSSNCATAYPNSFVHHAWILFKFRGTLTCSLFYVGIQFVGRSSCITFITVSSKWKPTCESELKIELAQCHKLSWWLVGFNEHIVFTVREGRGFTECDNTAYIKRVNTLRTSLQEHSVIIIFVLLHTLLMPVFNYPAVRHHRRVSWYNTSLSPVLSPVQSYFWATGPQDRNRTCCVRNQNCSSHMTPCCLRLSLV